MRPHPVFSVLWAAWYAGVFWALVSPENPWFGFWVLIAFLPLEAAALVFNVPTTRETLSEIMIWARRSLSRHDRFARGWNAAILAIILLIASLLGRTVAVLTDLVWLGWTLGVLVVVWLYDHWVRPEIHG